MNDLIFIAVTLVIFLSGIRFVDVCERLRGLK
jgi:hypothetical protein